jgi:hypothetical protein
MLSKEEKGFRRFLIFTLFLILTPSFLYPFEAKLFICEPRKAFWQNEKVLIGLFSPADVEGELSISAQANNSPPISIELLKERRKIGKGETLVWELPPFSLKPGDYRLLALLDGKTIGEEEIKIVSTLFPSHFLIGSTASPEENARIGANLAPLDLYNYAKLDGEGNFLSDPLTPSLFERGVERLIANGLKGFVWQGLWSGYVLHQPFEANASFLDPDIRKIAMQRAELGAQQARRFLPTIASLGGMDEPGLNYGVVKEGIYSGQILSLFPDAFQRSAYEKLTGKPLPPDPRNLSPEEWLLWMRWRANIMPDFFREARMHIKRVAKELPWGQDIYVSWDINDGANPFAQRLNDVPTTHSFMFWRGVAEQSWNFAPERVGRRDKRFHFASNTLYFVPNNPDEAALAEMVTNYAVMDGVGMLWHLNFQKADNLKPSIDRIKRLGDFILSTLPARHQIGVLYSFTEASMRLKEAGEVSNDEIYRISRDYAYECYALYHSIRRAGYPVDIVHEWELPEKGLEGRKILFLVGIKHQLPEKILSHLIGFRRKGGVIFADSTTTWFPPELGIRKISIDMSSYVREIEKIEKNAQELFSKGNYLDGSRLTRQTNSDALLDKYADVLAPWLAQVIGRPEIEFDKRGIIPGKWVSGEGCYYLLLNDFQKSDSQPVEREADGKKIKVYPASDWGDLKEVNLKFNSLRDGEAVYIIGGRDWNKREAPSVKPGSTLSVDFEPTEMKIIAVLPSPIERVEVKAKIIEREGRFIEIEAGCYDKGNRRISAGLPLEITIEDPKGKQTTIIWRSTDSKGIYREDIPLSYNQEAGLWKMKVRELFSGKESTIEIHIPSRTAFKLKPIPDVLIFDEKAIRSLLRSNNKMLVVVGEKASEEEKLIAKELWQALKAKGISAELREEGLVWKRGKYPKVFPAVEREGEKWVDLTIQEREKRRKPWLKLRVWAGENGYPPSLPDAFEVDENLILVGTDSSSVLIQALQRASILPMVANDYFPGKGRGILEYAWSPFALGKDVILITGSDPSGVRKSAERLLELLH